MREKERQMGRGEKTTDFETSENREEINRLGSVRVFFAMLSPGAALCISSTL